MQFVLKNVAVKTFIKDIKQYMEKMSTSELLEISREPQHLLFAYQQIRQEVAFLSNLKHDHVTRLYGVRSSPHLCLLLELAPRRSLRVMLTRYRDCAAVLEPLTLKKTALQVLIEQFLYVTRFTKIFQIAEGLEYLHSNQVVHLDMKSSNVLIWHFPSPRGDRETRVKQAGNVLIKITDYGISRISTGLSLKVGHSPVGTPGYMAPELFDRVGQTVSADKVIIMRNSTKFACF